MVATSNRWSAERLLALVAAAGFPPAYQATAVAVALAESGGNQTIISATGDYGLWQINHRAHPNYDTRQLLDQPAYNAAAALAISSGGANWQPWSAFKNGSYKRFLPQAQAAAKAAGVSGAEGVSNAGPSMATGGTNPLDWIIPGAGPLAGEILGGGTGGIADTLTGGLASQIVDEAYKSMVTLLLLTAGLGVAGLALYRLTNAGEVIKKLGAAGAAASTGGATLAASTALT